MPLGKEKITLQSVIIGAVTNFSLNIILIPKYQALGAGIATLSAESCVSLYQIFFTRKEIQYKKLLINLIEFFIAGIVMSFYVLTITKKISSIPLQIIISISGGAFLYFLILIILRNQTATNITKSFINAISKRIHK